jgi:hypothetical protein
VRRQDRPGRGVFFCTATVRDGANRRSKETIDELNALYADLDFKDIDAEPGEVRRTLQTLPCPPSVVTMSGHGLHALWLFREASKAPEAIAEVERLLRRLAEVLAADPQSAECSRMLRMPATHNTKGGEWIEVTIEVCEPQRRYDLGELAEWLDEARPLLRRKAPAGGNGAAAENMFSAFGRQHGGDGHRPPIDVEARLAAMQYRGVGDAGIHVTQLQVSAALLSRGIPVDEAVERLLAATRAAAERAGVAARWDWAREERDIRDMCATWLEKHPQPEPEPTPASAQPSTLLWHGEIPATDARSWLVADMLPEVGKGLLSGQWGSYKTFGLLDLAGAVMSGGEFAGHQVVRRGGVLLLAAEGFSEVAPRIEAALTAKHPGARHSGLGRAPFAWSAACPRLLDRDAADKLAALAREAGERMQREHGLPLALISIDTLTAAAGYERAGDENDAALGARIMNPFERVAQAARAMVLGVGLFG